MQNVKTEGNGGSSAGAGVKGAKECDLVMKGGITSGIVYPPLVIKLHEEGYSFRNVGGTSAGAIAAAVTAAAEHGKAADGFAKLNRVREWLGSDGHLLGLFQPSRKTAALMNTLLGYARLKWLKWPPLRALAAAVRYDLLFFAAGAAVGVGAAFLLAWLVGGSLAGRGAVVAVVAALVGGALAVAWHLLRILTKAVPANGFGLCTGRGADRKGLDTTVLTDWLHVNLNDMAGLPAGAQDAPLTFRDLWVCGGGSAEHGRKTIDLRMMTSDLSQNQPYVLPFEKSTFIFNRDEMLRLFPTPVVEHMVRHTRPCEGVVLPEGYHFLPEAKHLPVVVATRMSLSFPVLISMVPLYTISQKAFASPMRCRVETVPDRERPGEQSEIIVFVGQDGDGLWQTQLGDDRKRLRPEDLQPNWFSDGGICSNFPIHFFDSWLPTRPTFGVNLTSQLAEGEPGADITETIKERSSVVAQLTEFDASAETPDAACYGRDVYLPRPDETIPPQWVPVEGLGQFLENVFRTAQNYRDNMQSMLPSYRERIVQIRLTDDEGGINLNMDAGTIEGVVRKGYAAGELLAGFDSRQEVPNRWDAHRWVRFRVLMKQMEASLYSLRKAMASDSFYGATLEARPLPPGLPYPCPDDWLANARTRLDNIGRVIDEVRKMDPEVLFSKDSPLPEPVLRVMPEI
jgi:predicted acylesterase/phospholipase RssA